MRPPHEGPRRQAGLDREKIGAERGEVADGLCDEHADCPRGSKLLEPADHVVIERHEDGVVRHAGGLDDLDDALFEPLGVPIGLELDDDADPAFAEREHLGERGHALAGKLRPLAAADVDRAQRRGRRLPDLQRRSAHLHEVAVVDDHYLAVLGLLHVELDEVGAKIGAQSKGRQRVLGRRGRRAAVRDDQDLLIPPRDVHDDEHGAERGEDRDDSHADPHGAR